MVRNCTIKYCHGKEGKLHRTHLAKFSNGRIERNQKVSFSMFECDNDLSNVISCIKKRKILVTTTKRIQYKGTNFEESLADSGHSNIFLGCFKRKEKKMKVYPVDIFHCTPIFEVTCSQTNNEESYLTKLDALTDSFGSKHKQRAMNSRIRHNVSDVNKQSSISKSLDESYIQIKETEADNDSTKEDPIFSIIPPRNEDANNASEVYNLYDIISQDEYEEIEPQANILKNANVENVMNWEQEGLYSKFILHVIKNNIGTLTLHKSKLLAYYDYTVKFSKLKFTDLRKKDFVPGIPNPFKEMFTKNFVIVSTAPNGSQHKSMPPKIRDKLLMYAFTLALFITDFSVELPLFLRDYNVSIQKLTKLAQVLGCHIITRNINNSPTKVAILKLPLYKLETKMFGRGKRKNPL